MLLQKRWNVAYQFAPGEWTVQKAIDASKRPETYPIRPSPESREINTKLRAGIHLDDAEAAKLLLHAKETFNLSAVDVATIAAARTKGHDA